MTEEIAKLESDLDRKQDEELARLKLTQMSIQKTHVKIEDSLVNENNDSINELDNEEEPEPIGRVSKARKRREKKEKAEKERNERIIEQEALNVHGKRNVEIQAIKNILVKRDLMIYEIPSDGHWYNFFSCL